jgi:hypothetical protein
LQKTASATWKAIQYLEENKLYPRFDFQVKYFSDGTPEELIWMTPNMREICCDMGISFAWICKPDYIVTLLDSPTVP